MRLPLPSPSHHYDHCYSMSQLVLIRRLACVSQAVRMIEESELLQWEREHWEEEMNADYQDMLGHHSRKTVLGVRIFVVCTKPGVLVAFDA